MELDTIPSALKPFVWHGLHYEPVDQNQVVGDCMFCGKPRKFYANPHTGQWDCKGGNCLMEGNVYDFLEAWVERCYEQTIDRDWQKLAKSRGLPVAVFKAAGLGWDGTRWLIPIRNDKGTVQDVRCWRYPKADGTKRPIQATAGCKVMLWGIEELANPRKKDWPVWICEGEWDGMALRMLFRKVGYKAIVVAVPGANTFKSEWVNWFNGRRVVLAFDNDAAGDKGMAKVGYGLRDAGGNLKRPGMLAANAKSLDYIRWTPSLPDGWDMRDQIIKAEDLPAAWSLVQKMTAKAPRFAALPAAAEKPGEAPKGAENVSKAILRVAKRGAKARLPAFDTLVKEYRRWLDLSTDAVGALKLGLGVVLSNHLEGDNPLWVFVVGPPGSGKTSMVSPFAAHEGCVFRSNLGPKELVSGYPGNPDPSLLPLLFGKTLILKDMTELLGMPPTVQEEVFSTLRGAYDGHVSRSYGNGVKREYTGRFSMIAGVTNKIHGQSRANLGERYLKYQLLPQKKDYDPTAVIDAAIANIGRESIMLEALGDVTNSFLDRAIDHDRCKRYISKDQQARINALAQIIALLRGQVERKEYGDNDVLYRPQGEVGSRLGVQLFKTAMVVAEVSGAGKLLPADFALVERIAFDTAIGWHLDVIQAMMEQKHEDLSSKDIAAAANLPSTNTNRKIDDLVMLGCLQKRMDAAAAEHMPRLFYRVSKRIRTLWSIAKVGQHDHFKRAVLVRRRQSVNPFQG